MCIEIFTNSTDQMRSLKSGISTRYMYVLFVTIKHDLGYGLVIEKGQNKNIYESGPLSLCVYLRGSWGDEVNFYNPYQL